MSGISICRICLSGNIRMCSVANTPLEDVYEKVTNSQWDSKRRPAAVCYICHSQLKNCLQLREKSKLSEKIFAQLLETEGAFEFTEETIRILNVRKMQSLVSVLLAPLTIDGCTTDDSDIKEEPVENNDIVEINDVVEINETVGNNDIVEINDVVEINETVGNNEDTTNKEVVDDNEFEKILAAVEEMERSDTPQPGNLDGDMQQTPLNESPHRTLKRKSTSNQDNVSDNQKVTTVRLPIKPNFLITLGKEGDKVTKVQSNYKDHKSKNNNYETQKNKSNKLNTTQTDFSKINMNSSLTLKFKLTDKTRSCNNKIAKKVEIESPAPKSKKSPCNKIVTEINKEPSPPPQSEKPVQLQFPCQYCDKSFLVKYQLVKHMRIHGAGRPLSCTECDRTFYKNYELRLHMKIHTGEKSYACKLCDKKFHRLSYLNKHMKFHDKTVNDEKYECKHCNMKCKQLYNLQRHMRTHTGAKPYKCELCAKSFKQLANLQQHNRTHTGERPYCCAECSKRFSQLSHLKQHQRIHTGEKPFECGHCDKKFRQMSNLTQHMEIHKDENP